MFRNLFEFYRSSEWNKLLQVLKNERMDEDGQIICEYCGKPIVKSYDIIGHHKTELTEENVHDYEISLNPENISFVHHRCHNFIHNKLNSSCRKVYLIYGAPLSGKSYFVKNNMSEGDLVVDLENIWKCISNLDNQKPNRLKAVAFKMRDVLLDSVKYRVGKWKNAYIIGGYPLNTERERLVRELGAEEIFIDASIEECLQRLDQTSDGRDKDETKKYIESWFEKYTRP